MKAGISKPLAVLTLSGAALVTPVRLFATIYTMYASGIVSDAGDVPYLNGVPVTPGVSIETVIYAFDSANLQPVRSGVNGQPWWYSDGAGCYNNLFQTGSQSTGYAGNAGIFVQIFPDAGISGWPGDRDKIIIGDSVMGTFMSIQLPSNSIWDSSLTELSLLETPIFNFSKIIWYGPGNNEIVASPVGFAFVPEPEPTVLLGIGALAVGSVRMGAKREKRGQSLVKC